MNLEQAEIEHISSLSEHIGFKLLLDKLQAELDTYQQDILDVTSPISHEKIQFWRALNLVFNILKFTPKQMTDEFNKIKQNWSELENNNRQGEEIVPIEYMEKLLREYRNKKVIK